MTQIMSVSANAAVFAMEALRLPLKKGSKTLLKENAESLGPSETEKLTEPVLPWPESVSAVSARLTMLESTRDRQQATLEQAVDAYMRSGA